MTAPIHKTCYCCNKAVPAFVDPADLFGGQHGVCSDCLLTTAAAEAAREWRMAHPDQFDAVETPASVVLPDEPTGGPCEGCGEPAVTSDGEGVDLCRACMDSLQADTDEGADIPRENISPAQVEPDQTETRQNEISHDPTQP